MANELLDFVMSLVRDPQVAAQYAADPAQAIANAHLTDVTSADVNNLIPMVSDSFASFPGTAPGFGDAAATDSNVWTSGAATAAFDAFTPHLSDATAAVHDLSGNVPGNVIDTQSFAQTDATQLVSDVSSGNAIPGLDGFDPSTQLPDLGVDPTAIDASAFGVDHGVFDQLSSADVQHHLDADASGFDLLN
ncbi:IniB N-terminal domain-containing protein [soil metagenome]